jgi:hypothetical protein
MHSELIVFYVNTIQLYQNSKELRTFCRIMDLEEVTRIIYQAKGVLMGKNKKGRDE